MTLVTVGVGAKAANGSRVGFIVLIFQIPSEFLIHIVAAVVHVVVVYVVNFHLVVGVLVHIRMTMIDARFRKTQGVELSTLEGAEQDVISAKAKESNCDRLTKRL